MRILHYLYNYDLNAGGMQLFVKELAQGDDLIIARKCISEGCMEIQENSTLGGIEKGPWDMIILHTLKGLTPKDMEILHSKAKTVHILHDYYTICEREVLINNRNVICPGPYANNCVYCYMNKFPVLANFGRPTQNLLIPILKLFTPTLNYYTSRRGRMEQMLKNVDFIIAPTKKAGKIVSRFTGKEKLVNMHHFQNPVECTESLNETPVFGFIGNGSHHKGLQFINDSLKNISSTKIEIKAYGNIDMTTDKRIRKMGTFSHSDIGKIMGTFDILLFPSQWPETWGRAVSEAAACGKYILASNMTAVDEYLADYKGLILYDHHNDKELAKKMVDITRKWKGAKEGLILPLFMNAETYREKLDKLTEVSSEDIH